MRSRYHPQFAAARLALSPRAIPARVPILLAGRARSADPISAQKLVCADHAIQRADAGEQSKDQLAAGTYSRRAVWQLLGDPTSIGLFRESATGARRCRFGNANKPANRRRSATTKNCWQKAGLQGTEVWQAAKKANPELSDHLQVHKPYIDAVTYDSPFAAGARMKRVPDVIDCWFDSGAMPFAQWGFPHHGRRTIQAAVPGRLYQRSHRPNTRLVLQPTGDQHAFVFRIKYSVGNLDLKSQISDLKSTPYPHPFKNCIVLGLMLGEDGQKMSKSKRNYREPTEIFDKYGADALRWYFFAQQPPWTTIRYSEQSIKDSIPEFLLRLWNVYAFFVIYARIDGFDPASEVGKDVYQLTPAELATGEIVSTCQGSKRAGSLDPERAQSLRRGRDRANGRLRQLQRGGGDYGIRRRTFQLVRPPQPRSVLERRQARPRQA